MPLGFVVHDATLQLAMVSADSIKCKMACLAPYLISAFLVLVTLAELQLMVALSAHPVVAFGACLAYLVGGYFAQSSFFLGNGLMLARWGGFVNTGVATKEILAVSAAVCVASCIVGMCVVDKIDIYEKGEQ